VLPVQPRALVGGDDEELAAVRVGAGVGHRDRAADDAVPARLILERVAGPAAAGPRRIAALDHEALNRPVEDDAVVEAGARQPQEVLDRLRSVVVEQLDLHRAAVRVQGRAAHPSSLRVPARGAGPRRPASD
jgi:hypothetical protein